MIVIQHVNCVVCQVMCVSSFVRPPRIVFASYHWMGVYLAWITSVHDPVTQRDVVTWVVFLSCYWGWCVLWLQYELLPSQMCQLESLIITWYRTPTCESSPWLRSQLIPRDHCLTLFDTVYLVCDPCHSQESVSLASWAFNFPSHRPFKCHGIDDWKHFLWQTSCNEWIKDIAVDVIIWTVHSNSPCFLLKDDLQYLRFECKTMAYDMTLTINILCCTAITA